jgi:hypothetical protein
MRGIPALNHTAGRSASGGMCLSAESNTLKK